MEWQKNRMMTRCTVTLEASMEVVEISQIRGEFTSEE